MSGDLDEDFYEAHIRPIKQVSDRWWGRTVQKFGGALPVSMCKYWGELMGMTHGHVRRPLADLSDDEKGELRKDIETAQLPEVRADRTRESGETE